MSILNVDKIQPIGGGSTITVDATDIQASTGTIRASTFSGDVSATGIGVTSLNITGVTTSAGIVQAAQFKLLDNAKALYGDSGDLQIYHSTNSLIQNGTGSLQIVTTTGDLFLRGQDNITFNTAGNNERLRIDSSGRVLIGGNSNSASSHADELQIINTSAQGGLSIINASNGQGNIYFGHSGGTADGRIEYSHQADYMRFFTANNERLRITSSGEVGIGINNPTDPLHVYHASDNFVGRFESGDAGGGIVLKDPTHSTTLITNDGDFTLNVDNGSDVTGETIRFEMSGSEKLRIASDGHVAIGGYGDPGSILDVREDKDGAETMIRLFNTDNGDTTTQTAALYLSPDSRGIALTGLRAIKENASFAANAGRDVSLTLNVLQNNSQLEALRITSNGKVNIGTGELDQTDRMLNIYGGRARISGITAGNSFEIYASNTSGQSYGILCQAGTTSSDINTALRNTSGTNLFRVRGDGVVFVGSSTVQQGSTSKLEVMGTLNNSYPEYSYPIMVSDDAAYNSSAGPGGGIGFSFKQNSGGAYAQAGGIRGIKENGTDGNYASALTFYTRPNGSGTVERMRIKSNGELQLNNSTLRYNNTGGGFNQVKHLEFPIYFSSGATHTVLTIGGALDSGFVCFAVLEYIGLYSYAGQEMSGGVKRAFTRRRNNNTSWRAFNDQVSENIGENRRPTLFWDNNLLKVTTPGSTQITGYIRVSAHANSMSSFTLTR